jgi:5,10-methylenetetrahydromethanopterin reductase
MALVASHTKTLTLGTLVSIPSNRIAPVTASAVATINALAPGRVILGVGTGFTGRNTMGMPSLPVSTLERYVSQVRGLLAGEDVLFRQGKYERWIRLLHDRTLPRPTVNLDDPIPIHVAANGPKALAAAGRVGDGWITVAQAPEQLPAGFAAIADAAKAAGRSFPAAHPYTTLLTSGCVLRPGESPTSERVLRRVGPVAVVAMHAVWETAHGGAGLGIASDELARAYGEYIDALAAKRGSPADRRYLDVHEGHMVVLKPGEERFVDEGFLGMTITGPIESVRERVRALRDAGVDNLALQAVGNDGRELIEEFGREVIGKL